jgi:hypothetical protein
MKTFKKFILERATSNITGANSTTVMANAILSRFYKHMQHVDDLKQYGGGEYNPEKMLAQHLKADIEEVLGEYIGQPNPTGRPLDITLSNGQTVNYDNVSQGSRTIVVRAYQRVISSGRLMDLDQQRLTSALDMAFS